LFKISGLGTTVAYMEINADDQRKLAEYLLRSAANRKGK